MADKFVFSNFAVSTLAASIGPTDVVLSLNVDDVDRFPTLVSGAKFPLVIADSDDIVEIVHVTSLTVGGTATVERGREGTVPQSWLSGTILRHTFTAATVRAAAGLNPRGIWSIGSSYDPGDIVEYVGVSYIAVLQNIGSTPSSGNPNWQMVYQPLGSATAAMNWQGRWSPSSTYGAGQVVEYQGRTWQANATNINSAPTVGNPNWAHVGIWSGYAHFEPVLAFVGTNNYTVAIVGNEAPSTYYDGMRVVGRFATTNTTTATLAINALAAIPLRFKSGVGLAAGDIIAGELYEFVYVAGTSEFIAKLSPGFGNELAILAAQLAALAVIPPGTVVDYAGSAAPAGWLICDGAEFSRTGATANLFAAIGTTYGVGNGSTTANLPDYRGRVGAGLPSGTGRIPTGFTGGFSALTLGSVGGEGTHQLLTAELPVHGHGVTDPGHFHTATQASHTHDYNKPTSTYTVNLGVTQAVWIATVSADTTSPTTPGIAVAPNVTGISINNTGSNALHNVIQPTILINKIIKT